MNNEQRTLFRLHEDTMRRLTLLLPSAVVLAFLTGGGGFAQSPQSEPSRVEREVADLLKQLDSDRYTVRQKASSRLEELASDSSSAKALASELQRALVRSDLSFEVRKRLESLARRLPRALPQPVASVSMDEVNRLIDQLESDCYSDRLGAAERIEWLLSSDRLVAPIATRLNERMRHPDLSTDARQWLEPIAEKARGAWLASDPKSWILPAVSQDQVHRWIDELATEDSRRSPARRRACEIAYRELRDFLARDDEVPGVKAAISAKLAEAGVGREGAEQLQKLLDLTRPALVAEFWQNRQHRGSQYLLVGEPSWGQLAQRPSHFDRIDDQTAHCVSGQNLSPGDYPVGVAIPHPNPRLHGTAFFHLVNLPTPRRRMAYEYQRQRDEAQRLTEISRRTVERLLQRKKHLSETELLMLFQLDPEVMSALAAKMLMVVDDQPLDQQGVERLGGRPTHHGMLCAVLASEGTEVAIPALMKAIQSQRILPPGPGAPYQLDWIAALSIAGRHPWPNVDQWLAGLMAHRDPLALGRQFPPQLGATAAAALLERHHEDPTRFGLEAVFDPTMEGLGVHGYRFAGSDYSAAVGRWWAKQNP